MRQPRFWRGDIDPRSREAAPLTRLLLTPAAMLYARATARRIATTTPHRLSIPVICVGNLTAGGTGKSPVAAGLRDLLAARFPGRRIATLSRGYRADDVDAFMDRVSRYVQEGAPLTVENVRTIAFRPAFRGYDETQVDLLLDTTIRLMLAVR